MKEIEELLARLDDGDNQDIHEAILKALAEKERENIRNKIILDKRTSEILELNQQILSLQQQIAELETQVNIMQVSNPATPDIGEKND